MHSNYCDTIFELSELSVIKSQIISVKQKIELQPTRHMVDLEDGDVLEISTHNEDKFEQAHMSFDKVNIGQIASRCFLF